ncbi:MAG TPA: hypothetical protein V6C72_00615 [Chroococcales cyanobacterium]
MSNKDSPISRDTSPEAEDFLFRELAKRTPAEKLAMVSQMTTTVRTLALAGLRDRYPEDTEEGLKIRLAEQLYGADFARALAQRLKNK